MPAELERDDNGCRLCGAPLHPCELELRLCTICEEYAQQLGVRNEAQLEEIVAELMNDPLFKEPVRRV
jgi:hypothetical protein